MKLDTVTINGTHENSPVEVRFLRNCDKDAGWIAVVVIANEERIPITLEKYNKPCIRVAEDLIRSALGVRVKHKRVKIAPRQSLKIYEE